jgi:AraC-like DNA-binding protein
MDDLNTYRDGSLPVIQQEIHKPAVEILRCSYWILKIWQHNNLSAPYWRLYWNNVSGASVQLGDDSTPLDADHLVMIAPNTPYGTRIAATHDINEEKNVTIGCPFKDGLLESFADESPLICHFFLHFTAGQPYDNIKPNIFRIPIDPRIRALAEDLTQALTRDPEHFNHQDSFDQYSLITYALSQVPESLWPERPSDSRIIRILEYIDQHYSENLTNADFAELVNMSPNAFTRLFKQRTRVTPLAHLLNRRIERASILLHHTDESIEQIADACGFCDRNYFSRVFTKIYGVGPATYRRTRLS